MKFADTLVSAIIISAVLLFAYAVGLLIREARTVAVQPQPQMVAEANDAAVHPQVVAALAGGSTGQTTDVPEQAVKLKEQTQTAARPDLSLQKKERPPKGGASGRADKRRGGDTPDERERMRQRRESMSDEQRQSFKARTQSRSGTGRQPRRSEASGESTNAGQEAGENASEPDKNDQG